MIVFSGIDIVVDRSLGRGQIRDAVAASLSVENAKVAVICDVAQYPERGTADVVCVVTRTGGEFAAMISVQCEPNELPFSNILEVVARLSSSLQARVLAPDEGPDPYLMWLVEPDRPPRQVTLDETAFDDDRYEIRDE